MNTIQSSDEFAAARHQLGLSVSRCAALVKVEPSTLRRWEAGHRDPAPSACRILELALGDWLKAGAISAIIGASR